LLATARRSKNIAERVALELCESELQYGRLLESLECSVFVTGLDGRFIYANKRFYESFDFMPEDIIGKKPDEVFGDIMFQEIAAALEDNRIPKNSSRMLSIATASAGGKTKHLQLDLGFVWKNNTPTAIRGVIRDITESKLLEEELRAQTAATVEKARLCNILKAKNELLERDHRRLREVNVRLDKKLSETRRLQQIAEQMAVTDSVTKLFNHRYFQEQFTEVLTKAQENNESFSLLMIDIDGFKDYNDAFGHMAGDDALRALSKLLTASVRSTDIVARYGGEEFVILLLGADKPPASKVAENIRARIEAHSFSHETQRCIGGLTVSIGVATYPRDGTTKRDLLYAADMACYKGKREGKNRVVEA